MSVLEQARQIQAQTDAKITQGRVETQELKELLADTLAGIEGLGSKEVTNTQSPKLEDSPTIPWAWLMLGAGVGAGVVAVAMTLVWGLA